MFHYETSKVSHTTKKKKKVTRFSFFINNTFISNAGLKLANNQAQDKQHPEDELLLFENYSLSSSTLSSENNRISSKNVQKTSMSV